MHKTESFQKLQSIVIAFAFILIVGVVTNNVAAAPTYAPPQNNTDIVCDEGEFLNSLNGTCVGGLVGIPVCEDGFLYNDSTDASSPNLKCFDFTNGVESPLVGITGLSCPSGISGIKWNEAEARFVGTCANPPSTIYIAGPGDRNGGWTDWAPVNCAVGSTQTRSCTSPTPANNGADCSGDTSRTCPTQLDRITADIKVNGSDNKVVLTTPTTITVSWSSTNPGVCNIFGNGISNPYGQPSENSGVQITYDSTSARRSLIYKINCHGRQGDSVTDSVRVVLEPAPTPPALIAVNGTWSQYGACQDVLGDVPIILNGVDSGDTYRGVVRRFRTRTCTGASNGGTCGGRPNDHVEEQDCIIGACEYRNEPNPLTILAPYTKTAIGCSVGTQRHTSEDVSQRPEGSVATFPFVGSITHEYSGFVCEGINSGPTVQCYDSESTIMLGDSDTPDLNVPGISDSGSDSAGGGGAQRRGDYAIK